MSLIDKKSDDKRWQHRASSEALNLPLRQSALRRIPLLLRNFYLRSCGGGFLTRGSSIWSPVDAEFLNWVCSEFPTLLTASDCTGGCGLLEVLVLAQEEDGAMGKCPNHKNSHGKHYSHKSARRTKFEKKDILAIFLYFLWIVCVN